MYGPAYLRQPREVSIETFALCNAACTFCPYPSLERKGTKMPGTLIARLLAEMKDWREPFFISPFKVNEPFLDNRLQLFCESILEQIPLAKLRLFTNGQPLTDAHLNWVKNIPSERLAHLWISLNEFEAPAYRQLMAVDFKIVRTRLDNLHARIVNSTFPRSHRIEVSRVSDAVNSLKYSERDIRFLQYVYDRWPRFQGQIIKRDGWLGHVDPSLPDVPLNRTCGRWWELSICADGVAALCCMDGTGEFKVGNVWESSLLDIYNQPELFRRRERSLARHGIEPCQRCTY